MPVRYICQINALNLSLQGNEINLIQVKSALSGFKNKLVLYQQNLAGREFFQFFSLQLLNDTSNNGISNVDVETYSKHIQKLHEDMKAWFHDVFQLEIHGWVIDPFINISV